MTATITLDQLTDAKACDTAEFERLFGQSTTVTVAKARKVATLFDWDWAAKKLLSHAGRAAYYAAIADARDVYYAAMARPRVAYNAAKATAHDVYNAAKATAFAKCYIGQERSK